jgi:hypothetical protein
MKYIIAVFLVLMPLTAQAGNLMGILQECDSNAVWYGTIKPNHTWDTMLRNYSGTITQAEREACEAAYSLKLAKRIKRREIENYTLVLIQGINDNFLNGAPTFDSMRLWIEFGPGLDWGSLGADPALAKDIYNAGKNGVIAMELLGTKGEVEAFSPEDDIVWP